MVSWFHGLSLHAHVDRFLGFMVSWFISPCTPSLDSHMSAGFLISWFHSFMHAITGQWDADRFHGFVVLLFISPWSARNHETYCHLDVPEMECMKPWNHKIMKPIGFSLSKDGVHETMKLGNQHVQCTLCTERKVMKPSNLRFCFPICNKTCLLRDTT